MRPSLLLLLATMLAAAAPLLPHRAAPLPPLSAWPATFEGRPIQRLHAGPGDDLLARDFPGHVARFGDGRRQIVLRQVARATRLLHAPRDCFAALGYAIEPAPMRVVSGGRSSCFSATRGGKALKVCEFIHATNGTIYPDVPSWYWPALTGGSAGPWLAVMTVERAG